MTEKQNSAIFARLIPLLHDSDILTPSAGPHEVLALPPGATVTLVVHANDEGTREIGMLLGRLAAGHTCDNPDCQKGKLT